MAKIIARWILLAAALLLVDQIYDGVEITGFGAALAATFVLGLLNTLVRPVLVVLTLGLFLFVVNALMFWAAASLLPSLHVQGFGAALVGSLMYSACGIVIDAAVERIFGDRSLA